MISDVLRHGPQALTENPNLPQAPSRPRLPENVTLDMLHIDIDRVNAAREERMQRRRNQRLKK